MHGTHQFAQHGVAEYHEGSDVVRACPRQTESGDAPKAAKAVADSRDGMRNDKGREDVRGIMQAETVAAGQGTPRISAARPQQTIHRTAGQCTTFGEAQRTLATPNLRLQLAFKRHSDGRASRGVFNTKCSCKSRDGASASSNLSPWPERRTASQGWAAKYGCRSHQPVLAAGAIMDSSSGPSPLNACQVGAKGREGLARPVKYTPIAGPDHDDRVVFQVVCGYTLASAMQVF